MDGSLGMGFGTTLTPVLFIIGFTQGEAVPSVLLSELCAGLVAVIFHALLKNFKLGQKKIFRRRRKRRRSKIFTTPRAVLATAKTDDQINPETPLIIDSEEHYEIEEDIIIEDESDIVANEDEEIEEIKIENGSFIDKLKNLTTDTKVVFILATFGVIATIIAAVLSVSFVESESFDFGVKIYIGVMVFSMGIMILALRNKQIKSSMKRIVFLGALAGFNKGISGGGYGPITVSGQILAGREGRNAIASTSLSETIICFVGVLTYIISNTVKGFRGSGITWEYLSIAPYLIIGAVVAAPLAALVTNKVESKWLKISVGWATIFLGVISIVRAALIQTVIWDPIPTWVGVDLMMSA